jgi:O-antigen/teichoic acid export membrane protein
MSANVQAQMALLDAGPEITGSKLLEPTMPRPRNGAIHAIAQSIVARGAMIGVNAATGILTARALAPLGRGELSAMIMWPVFLANAMTLGIPNALRYSLRKSAIAAKDLIGAALLLSIAINVVAAGIAAALMPRILHLYSPSVIRYAQLFLINAPICILVQLCRASFEASENFKASTKSQWLVPSLNLFGLVLLALFHYFTPIAAGYVYVFGAFPVILWLVAELWKKYKPGLKQFKSSAKALLSYGIRSYGIDLCTTLSLYVDQTLAVGMLGAEALGTYVVALSLSRMLSMTIQASVVMVLFPKAVGRSKEEVVALTGKAARVSTLCTLSAASIIYAFGPTVLHLLYGRAYISAAPVLRILLIEVVLASLTGILAQAAMALGRPGIVTLLQSTGLALTVPFMMILIPRFGILGAAYALLLSTFCRFLFIQFSFRWFLGVQRPRLWFSRSDVRDLASHGAGLLPGLGRWLPAWLGTVGS